MSSPRVTVALAAAALLAAGCASGNASASGHHHRTPPFVISPSGTGPVPPPGTPAPGSCHASSTDPATVLPDKTCTPGVTNPDVTQANIGQTICVRGWTATIRPPVSYTAPLKLQQMAEYGYGGQPTRGFEEDHLISLELGGSPRDPRNLWPELGGSPNPKDKVENTLRARICSGQVTLAAAQHAIATDWTTALQVAR